ncbi:b8bcef7f-969b-42f0-8ae4-cfee0c5720dc [Sclerotinia trifoliorum]|uniref:B8bcef7f-969b-42f0-8ae4-cfee0c5720dc n=1 Tax=Sclerotinia trifoliorum TaxID=28548 RepID=A0A8H2ZNI0_9HELO|nr:b8bcef7f-969b-42f0-8ae4-cfee0c5720dc [Sclerotinia trifoliorum]
MSLQPHHIGVGCFLRPDVKCGTKRAGIPCVWNTLEKCQDLNKGLCKCPDACRQDKQGQIHPIVVLTISGDSILYVAMTGTPMDPDLSCTQYSPIGNCFPLDDSTPHPEKYRSRYWLRGPKWEAGTINVARQEGCHGTLELDEHSSLRLPHVYRQTLDRFRAFRGDNSQAMAYRLDESSYYRLMDRLSLHAGNYTSDIAPRALPRQATPPTTTWPPLPPSQINIDSSNSQYLPNGSYRSTRTRNGPSQAQRRSNLGRANNHSPSS